MKHHARGEVGSSPAIEHRYWCGPCVKGRPTTVHTRRKHWVGWMAVMFSFSAIAIGCGGNQGPSVGAFQSPGFDSIFIVVENQNFYDAAVFLTFRGGTRRRLATVSAYSTDQFSVRYDPSELWFHVDFVGARRETRSRAMTLNPGETVQLELTANAHRTGQLITRRRP